MKITIEIPESEIRGLAPGAVQQAVRRINEEVRDALGITSPSRAAVGGVWGGPEDMRVTIDDARITTLQQTVTLQEEQIATMSRNIERLKAEVGNAERIVAEHQGRIAKITDEKRDAEQCWEQAIQSASALRIDARKAKSATVRMGRALARWRKLADDPASATKGAKKLIEIAEQSLAYDDQRIVEGQSHHPVIWNE